MAAPMRYLQVDPAAPATDRHDRQSRSRSRSLVVSEGGDRVPRPPSRSWEIAAQVAIDGIRRTADAAITSRTSRRAMDSRSGKTPDTPNRVDGSPREPADPVDSTTVDLLQLHEEVRSQLSIAESYLTSKATIGTWWRGTRLEGTWGHIRNARVGLIELMDAAQLHAYSPRVLALSSTYLKKNDPERIAISGWFERLNDPRHQSANGQAASSGDEQSVRKEDPIEASPRERLALAHALQSTYERIADEYRRLRRFQISIAVASVLILALVGLIAAVGARYPDAMPLCFPDPRASVAGAPAGGAAVCPSGPHDHPASGDVAVVVLFGLLGAALTGVRFVLQRSVASSVPMSTTRSFQALLKGGLGMLAAVLGLLFLRAGVVPGFTQVDTQSQILVYAVVFGGAQELITRLIDQRSDILLSEVTSTEPPREAATDNAKSEA